MLSLILLVALSAPGDVSPREAIRFRADLALSGSIGLAFGAGALAGGVGASLDAGVTFADRYSVVLRTTLATLGYQSNLFLGGASFEVLVGEHASLGIGLSLAFLGALALHLPGARLVALPLRLSWMFSERDEFDTGRRGFFAFIEGFSGLSISAVARTRPPIALGGTLGFGYAWW